MRKGEIFVQFLRVLWSTFFVKSTLAPAQREQEAPQNGKISGADELKRSELTRRPKEVSFAETLM